MKRWLTAMMIISFLTSGAQTRTATFSAIDWRVQNIDAPTPDSLARLLTANYITGAEKVRAIYSWITSHIAYNTGIFKPRRTAYIPAFDPLDTASVWPSGDEMVARQVLKRRAGVCDGYAKLFKVLCNYAGIEAECVLGYGRTSTAKNFRTNHTWNAVKIDSNWHLLDVTWAAGYVDYADEFVFRQNDFYFLTPPEQFIHDHYPEDLRWTLLQHPPGQTEFRKAPFRNKNFLKYNVTSYSPATGLIEVVVGDTLQFSVRLKDASKTKSISADPFFDSTSLVFWPLSEFVQPVEEKASEVIYTYVVQPGREWIHLVYNDDIIMRYQMKFRESFVTK